MSFEKQKNDTMEGLETLLDELGNSMADFYGLIDHQFNINLSFKNQLPYGKMISDMCGVCMGLNSFNSALQPQFDFFAAVPFKSVPINPFTSLTDNQFLLDALNCSNTEEMEEEQNDLIKKFNEKFQNNAINFREMKSRLNEFDEVVHSVAQHIETLDKPIKYKENKQFGVIHSARLTTQYPDAGHLEHLLHILKTGEGIK